jgi:cysteine-rich repeat protein
MTILSSSLARESLMHKSVLLFASCLVLVGAGCTALVEGTLSGRGTDAGNGGMDGGPLPDTGPTPDTSMPDTGPMPDSGPPSPCSAFPDGTPCTVPGIAARLLCVNHTCGLSECGDGYADTSGSGGTEECDDGNDASGDGCESDCLFSCHGEADCDDGLLCDGTETCDATHVCAAGTAVPDSPATACTTAGGLTARCQGGDCRAGTCGDGVPDAGEECDDNNLNDGDGCQHDCTFTCIDDGGCQNGNLCDGTETCTLATHTCAASTIPLDCTDTDPCTNDTCDATMGCSNLQPDVDGDGSFAMIGTCGDDCDDNNPGINPTISEPCGSAVDLNCDGLMGPMTRYYRDCDGDDYAIGGALFVDACMEPAAVSGCSGGWTTRMPGTTSTSDCLDSSAGFPAHPGVLSYYTVPISTLSPTFDYNCSGANQPELPRSTSATVAPSTHYSTACTGGGRGCTGDQWYVGTVTPACGASATISYCSGTFLCSRTTRTGPVACH